MLNLGRETMESINYSEGAYCADENAPPSRAAIFAFSHAPLPLCPWRGSMGSVAHRTLEKTIADPDAHDTSQG